MKHKISFAVLSFLLSVSASALAEQTYVILAQADSNHVIVENRAEVAPNNQQVVLKIRLGKAGMKKYQQLLKESQTLPGFVLEGAAESGSSLEAFPATASWIANADLEGEFKLSLAKVPGKSIVISKKDVEVMFERPLPGFVTRDAAKTAASTTSAYMKAEGALFNPARECTRSPLAKDVPMSETIHSFVLLGEIGKNTVLATHYLDRAPQNFETVVKIKLNKDEMKVYEAARKSSHALPLFQTRVKNKSGIFQDSYFCLENLRNQIKNLQFQVNGTVYEGSDLGNYRLGKPVGQWVVSSEDVQVLLNRRLETFLP